MTYENLIVESGAGVVLITFNRPKAMNALNGALMAELHDALDRAEANNGIGVIVITGNERAFAAGVDSRTGDPKGAVAARPHLARQRLPHRGAAAGEARTPGAGAGLLQAIIAWRVLFLAMLALDAQRSIGESCG